VHEIYRRRKLAVARGTIYGQRTAALFKPGRENQGRKIGAMVNVEMSEQDDVELGHFRATLSETKTAAAASVY
jgi:hypothetical protein